MSRIFIHEHINLLLFCIEFLFCTYTMHPPYNPHRVTSTLQPHCTSQACNHHRAQPTKPMPSHDHNHHNHLITTSTLHYPHHASHHHHITFHASTSMLPQCTSPPRQCPNYTKTRHACASQAGRIGRLRANFQKMQQLICKQVVKLQTACQNLCQKTKVKILIK